MPGTKREPIHRPRHRPFTAEAIALFAELERVPHRRRKSRAFKEGEHQLMRLLGLIPQFWSMNSVLDDSEKPPWPPWLVAHGYWHETRAIRLQLLAAVEQLEAVDE